MEEIDLTMHIKSLVQQQIRLAGFPYATRQQAQEKILYALRQLRLNEKTKESLYCPKRGCRVGCRPKYSKAGRPSLSNEMTYLMGVLNNVWMQAFKKRGRLNRRGELETPFVKFCGPIMNRVNIYNVLDNLNKYRASVNRLSKSIKSSGSLTLIVKK